MVRGTLSARGIRHPFASSPALAPTAQSFLIPRYPGTRDEKPDLVDAVTLMTGIYLNFLQLVVENVEAQIGPIDRNGDNLIMGKPSFRDFLDDITLGTNENPGKIVGALRVIRRQPVLQVTGPPARGQYGVQASFWANRKVPNTVPVFFALMNQQHRGVTQVHTNQHFVTGAAAVRGRAVWLDNDPENAQMGVELRAIKIDEKGGDPERNNSEDFVMTGIVLFLKLAGSF